MTDKILETARQTIEIELVAIKALLNSLDDDFVKTVETIYKSKGRTILTGIGKSAIVAQKIEATLNSTGTPSVFMHAADAIHGDLGIVQPEDVVICLSKSGDTPEIKALVPLLKNFGNALIGMVSNRDSYLGKNATYILHTPIEKEADPNNLAPTASTTAQMVMGDALATSLLALRGFSSSDFAQFHPGGALGKQLYLRVRDIFPQHDAPSVLVSDGLKKTIVEMTSKRLGATAVLDECNNLIGVITDGDLRRLLQRDVDLHLIKAQDIMTPDPKSVEADVLAVEALQMMRELSITQLVVLEKEKYVGMIHLHDLLKEGLV